MTKARLLSTVAATLLLSAGIASAQDVKKDEAPGHAPAAQQKAPPEKIAPNMKAGKADAITHKPAATVGQAPEADKARASDDKAPRQRRQDKCRRQERDGAQCQEQCREP